MADAKAHQWTDVTQDDGTQIVFDTVGDEFIGTFRGMEDVPLRDGRSLVQAKFTGENGELYFTNAGAHLQRSLKNVAKGKLVRITYTDAVDTGQASPMRVYKVETAS